ncbi:MAG: ABC transporter ATP-binding protein [Actinomyces sp.]|uniref:ABC transporter ATP-binding protein n=1 Tax=Gleimia europaea TaxID=66228 RepID=UPI0027808F03|nr:ABC transporter ATP-binding protein [Gleimia europaea]MDP9833887.1 ATP-binding cassette subfamily B protein [Gleimia europaea]MDU4287077.1 ABC transporter ATP-binding protein [Actinomyces sp.]
MSSRNDAYKNDTKDFWGSVKRLFGELRPEHLRIWLTVLLTALAVSLTVAGPKLLGDGTNIIFNGVASSFIPEGMTKAEYVIQLRAQGNNQLAQMLESMNLTPGSSVDFEALARVLLLAFAVYALASLAYFSVGMIVRKIVQNTGFTLRKKVQDKIDKLPLSYMDSRRRGDLMSRVTNDVDNVTQSLTQMIQQVLESFLTIIGILFMMFWISWRLAILAIIAIPLGTVAAGLIAKKAQPYFRQQWKATGQLGGIVEEAYTGHEVMQAFSMNDEFLSQFDRANESLYDSAVRAQSISSLMRPAMMLTSNISYILVAVAGGLQVAAGAISLGGVQAFIQYSRQIGHPISALASLATLAQSMVASAERIFEFLDAQEMDQDAPKENPVDLRDASITFEHVRFGYDPEKPVIRDLSLTVEPGHMVAIVGPTGAGKTTLVNLLMRFYEIDSGKIAISGRSIADINKDDLRAGIGMVLQDTWLFEGTIAENIAYGAGRDVSMDEVVAAAKKAQAHSFIRHLPQGYDTVVKAEGSNLSQGERQLLTIARAFISRPDILILDEATSSVDTRTEAVIQEAMERLRKGRTSFVIAHRLSTIRSADVILVLEDGDVVEQGSHEELLAAQGAYAKLHALQFEE